jgi:3-carboxy-cis,cis-muconate cycloisomerase
MAGRTHLQHALPLTFSYKCAIYLSSSHRNLERLDALLATRPLIQFGGATGTLASLGSENAGLAVHANLATQLGLREPAITWHVARDNIAEVISVLGIIGGSLGKIALDLMLMSSNEVSEVSEPFVPHRGASSTMPQKRNPISSEVVLAALKLLRANAGLALDAMVCDFERASGPWHLEWVCVPESFVYCSGALHQATFALGGLVVNVSAMATNLASTRGLIAAEAVMMGLASYVGRQPAHDIVYEACRTSIETSKPLLDVLLSNETVSSKISAGELAKLCDPLNYMGSATRMVDDVLQHKVV